VALSTAKLKEWLAADLSGLDLLVIQIDGLHVGDHVLVAAIGIDGAGDKHELALALGATENAAVVKALLADLIERGLQPDIARLFIVDGAKALSRAVRDTFGGFALIQRCQVHAISKRCSVTSPLPAKIWQRRTQPMAPAAPISKGTETIRIDLRTRLVQD
jgi:transposase-like protein